MFLAVFSSLFRRILSCLSGRLEFQVGGCVETCQGASTVSKGIDKGTSQNHSVLVIEDLERSERGCVENVAVCCCLLLFVS